MGLFGSTVGAIRKGLKRTRTALTGSLRSLLTGRQLDEKLIDEIETYLLTADVGVQTTTTVIDELRRAYKSGELTRGEAVIDFLKQQLKSRWSECDRTIAVAPDKPTVILVVGINGVGKTTSVAKIAKSLRDEGRTVLLAAADTFRAGAVAQLEIWSQRIGVEVIKGTTGADPAAVAYDACQAAVARGVDALLIDTAGRMHNAVDLMRQLGKIRSVVAKRIEGAPHEVLLVLDATQGQNALQQASQFKDTIDVSGIFLAKLDGTAKGGIVLAIRDALDVPVKLIGVGETLEDVEPFDPDAFIDALFAE